MVSSDNGVNVQSTILLEKLLLKICHTLFPLHYYLCSRCLVVDITLVGSETGLTYSIDNEICL